MRIIARRKLVEFWETHPDTEHPLRAWYSETKKASWNSPVEIKNTYRSVSILPNNRVVFNIGGNNYRLVARISYRFKNLMVRFIGTHKEYDDIDPSTI